MAGNSRKRLDSWKEIADHLGRDVRTAIRWEKDKRLPIHRVPGGRRQAVFAFTDELDAWLLGERDGSAPEDAASTIRAAHAGPRGIQRTVLRGALWILAAVTAAALGVALDRWLTRPLPQPRVSKAIQLTNDGHAKVGPIASDGKYLYFNERVRGVPVIARISPSGEDPTVALTGWKNLAVVDVSRDGSEMLAASTNSTDPANPFWILRLPSGEPRLLAIKGRSAAFSPDGKWIAYFEGSGLYVAGDDGSGSRRLATVTGIGGDLRWSPDGSRLRFDLLEPGDDRTASALWEVSADGTDLHPLLPRNLGQASRISGGSWCGNRDYFLFQAGNFPDSDLWMMGEGQGALQAAEDPPVQLTNGPVNFSSAICSSDGKRIFALGKLPRGELMRVDLKSGRLSPYLDGISADGVAFSPDGKWVAYSLWPERTLWESRTDGSQRRQLTSTSLDAFTPQWSPDGRTIAFIAFRSGELGRSKIYLVSAAGSAPRELIPGDFDQANPSWSPDGKSLAFAGAPWTAGFHSESTAIRIYDFSTRRISTLPGSGGLWAPKWSPKDHEIVAETTDSHGLEAFDFRTRKWTILAQFPSMIGYACWSHDGKFLYLNLMPDQDAYRVNVSDGQTERVASLKGIHLASTLGIWFGLGPDDSPLVLRDTSVEEVYALDVSLP